MDADAGADRSRRQVGNAAAQKRLCGRGDTHK
jgi:hypothetical protein